MYRKIDRLLFFILLLSFPAFSQDPGKWLEKKARLHPIEKVYLHFDRESYLAGETAWFKAYLSSDHLPDTISTTLYAELISQDQRILDRKVIPVIAGMAIGYLEFPDTLVSGNYMVRSYTRTMFDHSPGFLFTRNLTVFGKTRAAPAEKNQPLITIRFFPEGGNLVTGLSNNVAFKATYPDGTPAPVTGVVKNTKGQERARFRDQHDGMGFFELNPEAGEKYIAETENGSTPLPEPVAKGITLNFIPHPQGFFYELQQKKDDPLFTAAYFLGQMQHHVVFKQQLNPGAETSQGIVNTSQLRPGILQVTFFNRDGMPLAERLWFVHNKDYLINATVETDTLDMRPRARNHYSIGLPGNIQGSISVSVTDAGYEEPGLRENNILSSLLLASDLRGSIHRPSYYFSSEHDSVRAALDLVMMTNGWRRFNWSEQVPATDLRTDNPAYISLEGRIFLRGTQKPFAEKPVLLMIHNMIDRKQRSTHLLQTDKNGDFRVDSLLFFGRNLLLFSDIKGKKSQYVDVSMGMDSLHRGFALTDLRGTFRKDLPFRNTGNWKKDYDDILKASGLMLEGVTVSAKKKSPMEEVDEKYTRGLFNGEATRAIDLVNSGEALPYDNVFDYLQDRVNGLQVLRDGGDYGIYYRQTSTLSSLGNPPMTLYLDEIETDASVIATLPASKVALVKLYSSFAGSWGNAPGGVLAIYTKKPEDYGKSGDHDNIVYYNGYAVQKEFYAPDYRGPSSKDHPDNRITIDWRPFIPVNGMNARIPLVFYNNDRTRRFKVVVEGMTQSGQLIWLEKTLQE